MMENRSSPTILDGTRTPRELATQWLRKLLRLGPLSRTEMAVQLLLNRTTLRRILNLAMVEAEYRLRRVHLISRPYVLVIDPLNVCNLRCPLCPTGTLDRGRKAARMEWSTYTSIIDEMAPWAFKVNLFNWGEPLLHPHINDMIRYASQRNLSTALSTNFSLELDDTFIADLAASGLDLLCVSLDGVTQSSYEVYRRRGHLDTALSNARRLLRRRRELGARFPILEWQFIAMSQNEGELAAARALAQEIGFDRFRVIDVSLPFGRETPDLAEQWFPRGRRNPLQSPSPNPCQYLYRYLVVNPDAQTSPCCRVYGAGADFGDRARDGLAQIWNNDLYKAARAHYRTGAPVPIPTVCDACDLYEKRSRYVPERRAHDGR